MMYDVKKLVSLFVIRLYIKKENSDKKKKCTSKERKKKFNVTTTVRKKLNENCEFVSV